MKLKVTKTSLRLRADHKRVIARRFVPAGASRVPTIVDRIVALSEDEVSRLLADVLRRYTSRHRDITGVFERHYDSVVGERNKHVPLSQKRRQLIGAYFTSEYSLESVALFNPSIVRHPDQDGLDDGAFRFIMSLRACGEGHISSIEFRSGIVESSGGIAFDPVPPFAASESPVDDHLYDKNRIFLKLSEMGVSAPSVNRIFVQLPEEFTIRELDCAIDSVRRECSDGRMFDELAATVLWLAHSNYRIEFPPDSAISERVIFPVTENESRGVEDARFVRFTMEDGGVVYYATYTAYNGLQILPQLIQTTDFTHFRIYTLSGRCVQNKGMALFPRKVAGQYVMISRLDGENLFVLRSDDVHFWNEGEKIHGPTHPWEFVQIGNCGSPLETEKGWLLITHGVGPMREYWIGALLLDLDDPSRVIGHLKEPILMPTEEERDGYVPNVVYSCGGMIHQDTLILPYGISDTSTGIVTISVKELLSHLARP